MSLTIGPDRNITYEISIGRKTTIRKIRFFMNLWHKGFRYSEYPYLLSLLFYGFLFEGLNLRVRFTEYQFLYPLNTAWRDAGNEYHSS